MERNRLIEYVPPVLQDVEEYQVLMSEGEQPHIDALWNEVESALHNQFIADADESGVERYERLVDISPNPEETLEVRKLKVMARWNNQQPYTMRTLEEKMDELCGAGNYSITMDYGAYTITIEVDMPMKGQVDELERMLAWLLPANLVAVGANNMAREMNDDMYQGTAVVTGKRCVIEQDEEGEYAET